MTFGIFDHQFELTACLSNGAHSKVYLGSNRAGEKVVVKFLLSSEQFFEELARYYACDGSPYLPRLLYNYPAYSISQAPVFFSKDILALFDCRDLLNRSEPLTQEEMMASKMAEVGVLILEYVEGGPLLRELRPLGLTDRLALLEEVANALRNLHENGEFHGDLTPENVLLDPKTGRVRLIDLGFFSGKRQWTPYGLSPEHREGSPVEVGPASDIYMFASQFLTAVENPERRLRALIARCMREKPEHRPEIGTLCAELKRMQPAERAGDASLQISATSLRAWARRVFFLALAFSSVVGITWIAKDPILEKRKEILATAPDHPTQSIEELKTLRERALETNKDRKWAHNLVGEIAKSRKREPHYRVREIPKADQHQPIAVLAFVRDPVLIGRNEIFQLGDWVHIGNETGYICDINWRQITLDCNGENRHILLDKPPFTVPYSVDVPCAVIWDHVQNLPRLLHALDALNGPEELFPELTEDGELAGLPLGEETNPRIENDETYGAFEAKSLEEFLPQLRSRLRIRQDSGGLHIATNQNQLPLWFTYRAYSIPEGTTLARLCKGFEMDTGYPFSVSEKLGAQRLSFQTFTDSSWEEMLTLLGFKWEINKVNGTYRVLVEGTAP